MDLPIVQKFKKATSVIRSKEDIRGKVTFSEALKKYKAQKESFKNAEEELFSLFRSKKNRPEKIKTVNELQIGITTMRR